MGLAGYDAWKTTPPDIDARDTCPSCGDQEGFAGDSCVCGWNAEDDDGPEPAYDTIAERDMDRD
jgi:hypothetical protein